MKEKGDHRLNPERVKELVGILMESRFYFDLNLTERHGLIRYLLYNSKDRA